MAYYTKRSSSSQHMQWRERKEATDQIEKRRAFYPSNWMPSLVSGHNLSIPILSKEAFYCFISFRWGRVRKWKFEEVRYWLYLITYASIRESSIVRKQIRERRKESRWNDGKRRREKASIKASDKKDSSLTPLTWHKLKNWRRRYEALLKAGNSLKGAWGRLRGMNLPYCIGSSSSMVMKRTHWAEFPVM